MAFGLSAGAIGLIGAAGSIAGGLIASNGASDAAQTQANAASNAQQISQNEFNTITQQEQPFMQAGYNANNSLSDLLGISGNKDAAGYGSLVSPFTAETFKQYSPAYQFQQQQGMQGVLNGDSSSKGALSGGAQKDLIDYNQNLANTAWNNAFNQYQTQQGNIYSRLAGIAQLGQNAATNTGAQGTALAGQAAQSATNIGTALGAGQVGSANAWSGAINSAIPWLSSGLGGASTSSPDAYAGTINGSSDYASSYASLFHP